MKEEKKQSKWIYWVLGIIVVLFIIFSTLLIIPVSYTKSVEYIGTEQYQDTEQYMDTQSNQEYLQYKPIRYAVSAQCIESNTCQSYSQVCVQTNWLGNCIRYEDRCNNWLCSKDRYTCSYYLKNLDNQYGSWQVYSELRNKDTNSIVNSGYRTAQLYADDETTLKWTYDSTRINDHYECSYQITSTPQKTVTSQVIRDKQVTKERPVTKTRDERRTCSAFAYLFIGCN